MKKEMIKRADGSVSQRGLWDNIRANKGSGKKPTAAMLKQEKKIKAKSKMEMGGVAPKKAMMGAMMENPMMKMGGSLKSVDKAKNPGLAKLPTPVRNKMGYKKYGGAVDMMQAGGVVKSQPKRVGPVDPDGAYTKVQERTLAGAKVKKVPLTKDKELGATKMKKGGKVSKKK